MELPKTISLTHLNRKAVQGVVMDQVHVLRLDLLAAPAPGNKIFKLRQYLVLARQRGLARVVSFGGGWSNHLHALAAVGAELGLETVGLVRGEEDEVDTPTLADARTLGMDIRRLTRGDYRRRNDVDFLAEVEAQFQPCLVIPEGGGSAPGIRGCLALAECIKREVAGSATVVLPVGTGATLAGLVAGLSNPYEVLGISALKSAGNLEQRVLQGLAEAGLEAAASWQIRHDFHCGGFARWNEPLREFMLEFERIQRIPLEPVYTGKMMYAIHRLLQTGELAVTKPVLAVHTGGLQGRRGYDWLDV
jgi:1-aminocyclopropane-1-carboxylate deaminase